MRKPKKQKKPLNDLSRSLTPFDPNQTLLAVIIAGIIPGVERQPLKKLAPDENELLKLLERWRAEAEKAGHKITRIAVAFETGRGGFWLARWLSARYRGPCHPCRERAGTARAPACQDRSARYPAAQARLSRLAAR